jgi:hypothetical protein
MADKSTIPGKEEIARLPHWARVAFAARCAQIVGPLFRAGWPEAPEDIVRKVHRAVDVAVESAARAELPEGAFDAAADVSEVIILAKDRTDVRYRDLAAYAANAALFAIRCAIAAGSNSARSESAINCATFAATYAFRALSRFDTTQHARQLNRLDFDLIEQAAAREGWTDESPIPSDFFGPLPDIYQLVLSSRYLEENATIEAESMAFPLLGIYIDAGNASKAAIEAEPDELPLLEIYIDPGNASKATIQEVLERLSDLHRAAGGFGLEFRTDGTFVLREEEVRR